ncbi:phosphodiesterase [Maricaulis sp. W15]|uniref:nucleotide pyrophosphatase/phosphodiesterase family protein n=1 Tax=Maricaulis sp. W15 TaxID=1772333 RepID=UPI00094919EF|nr:nucleotide pyrophosphatase/phosphodiesterase family protein [Maricaulis sp. W15]OLF74118.1 phosphodiesterase [Maricaulis sp. W15]
MLARLFTLSALASLVAACSHLPTLSGDPDTPLADMAGDPPVVIMIGLDGLRFDAIDRHEAPNLRALAARGTRPERMISAMPTKTFVNFYSLATGLYPEHHGMVSNSPWDRRLDETFSNSGGSPQDPRWWGGEPIWITAEQQGLRSHIMFWLGSEVEIQETRPTVWHPYEHGRPYEDRVAEVLEWFDAPLAEQPRFAAVYFDHVDTIEHRFGVETEAEADAVAHVDALVGDLVAGLEARGVMDRATIIIVSDHGMVNVSTERTIAVDAHADLDGLFIEEFAGDYGAGLEPFLMGYGDEATVDRVYAELRDADPHMRAYRRQDMPAHWHFDHPDRGPDLFILADPGWLLTTSETDLSNPYLAGLAATHGYDNHADTMGATFIGAGPIFPEGSRPAAFENINVYGLIACALDLEPARTDGSAEEVERITGGRCPAE